MSLQTITPDVDKEARLEKLLKMLRSGKFEDARDYADSLLEEGIPETTINKKCYGYFDYLSGTNKKKAERLAKIFHEYRWECWLK